MYDINDKLPPGRVAYDTQLQVELGSIHGGLEEVAVWLRGQRLSGDRPPRDPATHIARAARAMARAQADPHQWRRELVAAAANILSWIQRNPLAALSNTEKGEI